MSDVRYPMVEGVTKRLTMRQDEVFSCYLCGDTETEIARYLGVTRSTVRGHLRRLAVRLGAATLEAVNGWYHSPSGEDPECVLDPIDVCLSDYRHRIAASTSSVERRAAP